MPGIHRRLLNLVSLTAVAFLSTLLLTSTAAYADEVRIVGKQCSDYVACASLHVNDTQEAVRAASFADGLNVRYQYAMRTTLHRCEWAQGLCNTLVEQTEFQYQTGVTAMSNKTVWRHHGAIDGKCYRSWTDLRRRTNFDQPYVKIDEEVSRIICFGTHG